MFAIAKDFVRAFVNREYRPIDTKEEEKKMKEILIGYEGYKKIDGDFFVILRLPEGSEAAIDSQGRLYDLIELETK